MPVRGCKISSRWTIAFFSPRSSGGRNMKRKSRITKPATFHEEVAVRDTTAVLWKNRLELSPWLRPLHHFRAPDESLS